MTHAHQITFCYCWSCSPVNLERFSTKVALKLLVNCSPQMKSGTGISNCMGCTHDAVMTKI